MTPDDPRRTCIYGHAKKCNSNFSFGKDNTLIALRGGEGEGGELAPAQKVDNVVHGTPQFVSPTAVIYLVEIRFKPTTSSNTG